MPGQPVSGPRTVLVGAGRAGGAFHLALGDAGWPVELVGHDDLGSVTGGPDGPELVLLCVPDGAVAEVAAQLPPDDARVVAHCAGSLGLDALAGHPRVGSVHPLVSLPDARSGAARLRGAWFAVAGDPVVAAVAEALEGRVVTVGDDRRAVYHAAAVVASNHLVALFGQVERLAAAAGVPAEAYVALAGGSLDNAARLGAAAALTGPVARGDWDTVRRHLAAVDPSEHEAYLAVAGLAARLAGRELPPLRGG